MEYLTFKLCQICLDDIEDMVEDMQSTILDLESVGAIYASSNSPLLTRFDDERCSVCHKGLLQDDWDVVTKIPVMPRGANYVFDLKYAVMPPGYSIYADDGEYFCVRGPRSKTSRKSSNPPHFVGLHFSKVIAAFSAWRHYDSWR